MKAPPPTTRYQKIWREQRAAAYARLLRTPKGPADPSPGQRRVILALADAELCCDDLVRQLGLPQSSVSRKLDTLRRYRLAGVVRQVGAGRGGGGPRRYYRLTPVGQALARALRAELSVPADTVRTA